MTLIFSSIGLMSGTSVDGSISVALIRTDGDSYIERVATCEFNYEPAKAGDLRPIHHLTKAAELAYREACGDYSHASLGYRHAVERYFRETFPHDTQEQSAERCSTCEKKFLERLPHHSVVTLDAVIECSTILHAQAVEHLLSQIAMPPSAIALVGYHGQTLYHAPFDGVTVQVGDAAYLARRVGIPVIYDFRTNDIIHGGQGAPLAPVYHRALAKKAGLESLCVLNLGGTANITIVSDKDYEFAAFDTGPANGLIDRWVKERANQGFDRDSSFASKGIVDPTALTVLLERAIILANGRNYLDIAPPKSLDIRDYHYNFPEVMNLSLEDGCATLNAFTAECIVRGLQSVSKIPKQWIVCGGGVHNVHVLSQIQQRIKRTFGFEIELLDADAVGWSSAAMEAELFAFLAVRCDHGLPITYPETTGVSMSLSGGKRQDP